LTLRDRDLISIQEARELVSRAAEAQRRFASSSQQQVDAVVEACAAAANEASASLARLAVEETGYGNVPDKIIKNTLGATHVLRAIRGIRTVGIVNEDKEKGIVEFATPVGVVAAIIPCTNPTSTSIYKTLISIKARNGVVLSPHPSAVKCIRATADVLAKAASRAGAPDGLIGCMEHSTMQGTQELWRQREVGVILATGGAGLVRAAYASGKPAFGVGPGNVPAYIERTANVCKAVADIFAGKTFDYGTICSSEQAIVCDEAILDQALEECRNQGAYFLSEAEIKKMGALVFRGNSHAPNPEIVGKPATMLAEMAGFSVPPQVRVLIARLSGVGRDHPLSAEKLSPILAFYSAPNTGAAIELCTKLLRFGGAGHTASVHTQNEGVAKHYGESVPAFRVCVNTAAVHGSIGYSTNLFPAMTLGCGAVGGNSTSDNIGPQHLMNLKRVAWESRPIEHRTIPADRRMVADEPAGQIMQPTKPASAAGESAAPSPASVPFDRAVVAQAVEHVMQSLGIPRGGTKAAITSLKETIRVLASPPAQATAAVIPSPAVDIVARVFSEKSARPNPSPALAPKTAGEVSEAAPTATPPLTPTPNTLIPKLVDFVSESDVRMAIRKNEKIFVGPKTIVTPAARDLASSHDVLVESKSRA
jgi:acetaldehyde dehydrogenase (acetylating)